MQDIEKCTDFGPDLTANISESFVKTVKRPLAKESRTNLKEKLKIPNNCKEFLAPKVNQEIWRLLPAQAKLADLKQQQQQQVLSLNLANLATMANTVVVNKEKMSKEIMGSLLRNAIDGANILGDNFQSISERRRFDMKKYLNPDYAGICSMQVWLKF